MKYLYLLRSFFRLLGSPMWWEGVDNPTTIHAWVTRRVGFASAWCTAKTIWLNYNNPEVQNKDNAVRRHAYGEKGNLPDMVD